MAEPNPELIFLTGPQEGERAVLMQPVVVAGRSRQADVLMSEESVSRQQVQFELTNDGWTMVNLSSNGTEVNGKRYTKARRIVLDTGDIIGVGGDTKLLFVGPADDPEEALRAWRAANPVAPPAPPEPRAQPEPQEAPPAGKGAKAKPGKGADEDEDTLDAEEKARRRKRKIYIIGGAVYGVLMLIVALALTLGGGGAKNNKTVKPPRVLNKEDFSAAVLSDLSTDMPAPNDALARKHRRDAANIYYPRREYEGPDLYKTVYHFKLHFAYRQTDRLTTDEAAKFREAKDMLIDQLTVRYQQAVANEKNQDWREAIRRFEKLRIYMPVRGYLPDEPKSPEEEAVFDNIIQHLAYNRRMLREQK